MNWLRVMTVMSLIYVSSPYAEAQLPPPSKPAELGPYNAQFLAGGDGLVKPVPGYGDGEKLDPMDAWTMHAWIKPSRIPHGASIVAAVGDAPDMRALVLDGAAPALLVGDQLIRSTAALKPGTWYFIAAAADGHTARLMLNGKEVAHGTIQATAPLAVVNLAPRSKTAPPFAGRIAGFTVAPRVLSDADLRGLGSKAPEDDLVPFEEGAAVWPIQLHQQAGLLAPQPAWTLPKSNAPFSKPVAKPAPKLPALAAKGDGVFAVNGWKLAEAPKVAQSGEVLSKPGLDTHYWYVATVPGTVLTTLVDRGVYPDPTIGLNNLAIPEHLNKQDYWYRSEFTVPAAEAGKHLFLNFNGVNYTAEIWLNGEKLGTMKGAFIRGSFDVTGKLLPGRVNAVAVRVSPPPHPGIPHEQSLSAGRGDNGGIQALDGPAFVATEGWDWIPGIRDRNTGLWQDVEIASSGAIKLGDAKFVTTLPKPDNSVADVTIDVPLQNLSDKAVTAELHIKFDDVDVVKQASIPAHGTVTLTLAPSEFPQLAISNPKLWWPNGYGDPALHTARLVVRVDGAPSDARQIRFGMREVTYEISLMDEAGDLRRVGLDLNKAAGHKIVAVDHDHIRKVPGSWSYSLAPGAENSPAVTTIDGDEGLAPDLLIKVNGVRIAARGGNIGMDDLMKRVGRDRQEPFFRLERTAHINIIRNWVGQNTEESFYDLADEYGLMVLNDFWESTQNNNVEIEDVPLFLANAEDTVRRFRNHPSIVLWFGRNEGVPQPVLNEALEKLIRSEDGTRLYMGSSNQINLAPSGPYNWREPEGYFTEYAKGFAVELGTPSFPTLEAWQRAIPKADQWPINDVWAYHDWHQDRNGSVHSFMDAMNVRFGAAVGLADFERKAQMLEYEAYRAIFEGFNAGLWKTNSGRMLWMTQPAWPSSHWQIMSSDYDTHGAFYGVQKASEPVHVQMNLPDFKVVLVNNRRTALSKVTVHAKVVTLDNRRIAEQDGVIDAPAGSVSDAFTLDLAQAPGPVLVRLTATDAQGALLSDNFYWQARDPAALKALDALAPVKLDAQAAQHVEGQDGVIAVTLANKGHAPALAAKLTLFDAHGKQVLPAYFTDNYVSLLPGETKQVEIRYPASEKAAVIKLRGWNVAPGEAAIAAH